MTAEQKAIVAQLNKAVGGGDISGAAQAARENKFEQTPVGQYIVRVDSIELTTAGDDDKPVAKWTGVILRPEESNGKQHSWMEFLALSSEKITPEQSMQYHIQSLLKVDPDLEVEKVSDLPKTYDKIGKEKPLIKIKVKKSKSNEDYTNTVIIKRIEESDDAESEDSSDD